MKRLLSIGLAVILGFAICSVPSCSQNRQKYYWVMDGPCPESDVRFWLPAELADHKDCEKEKVTPALALAIVINMTEDVDRHRVHYHIRHDEDRGFVLTEYLKDEGNKAGERPLGREEVIHYHGIYVGLKAATNLIAAVKGHQHGAD